MLKWEKLTENEQKKLMKVTKKFIEAYNEIMFLEK